MTVQVFVSSTFKDLEKHRARAIDQLRNSRFHVDTMEDWPPDTEEAITFSLERIRPCQLCVLLIGFRRGFVPESANLSITQQEIAEAERLGIPVLPFLLHENVKKWSFDERTTDPEVAVWRHKYRSRAGNDQSHFRADPKSLDILPAIMNWLQHQESRARMKDYLAQIQAANSTIHFLGLPPLKEAPTKYGKPDMDIADQFVEPGLSTEFISPDSDPENWKGYAPLLQAVSEKKRLVVLGDPGTGKSTLVKWIAWNLASSMPNAWKAALGDCVPLPFVLRDLEINRDITWDRLLDKFLTHSAHGLLTRGQLDDLLRTGKVVLLIDGLDEIGDVKTRERLRDAIWRGMDATSECRWLLTSRNAGYSEVVFDSCPEAKFDPMPPNATRKLTDVRHVVPFDDARIADFTKRWYAIREVDTYKAKREAENLTKAIHRDRDTVRLARIPNLLTIMSMIYRIESDLPHGKANLYEKICTAYLETIDKYYRILSTEDSTTQKKSWLGELAFRMQQNRVRAKNDDEREAAVVADRSLLCEWLKHAMPKAKDDSDAPAKFLDRIKLRSGLMIERAPNRFAFAHLSFQEFFAAIYLAEWVRSDEWLENEGIPAGTTAKDLGLYAQESDWREVLVFLFELLAELKPARKKKVRDAVFGANWEAVSGSEKQSGSAAILLARLAIDPQSGWNDDTREAAIRAALGWVVRRQQKQMYDFSCPVVLKALLDGETACSNSRLVNLVEIFNQNQGTFMSLNHTGVSDLTPLAGLEKLTLLSLENTEVSDLSPLAGLTGLTLLSLDNTDVMNVMPLSKLNKLSILYLGETGVTDLRPLAGLFELTELNFTSTRVSNIKPLIGLKKLMYLTLKDTDVSDVTPLAGLKQLTGLSLDNTSVSDVTPLAGLTGLATFFLRNTGVSQSQIRELQAKLPNCKIHS